MAFIKKTLKSIGEDLKQWALSTFSQKDHKHSFSEIKNVPSLSTTLDWDNAIKIPRMNGWQAPKNGIIYIAGRNLSSWFEVYAYVSPEFPSSISPSNTPNVNKNAFMNDVYLNDNFIKCISISATVSGNFGAHSGILPVNKNDWVYIFLNSGELRKQVFIPYK